MYRHMLTHYNLDRHVPPRDFHSELYFFIDVIKESAELKYEFQKKLVRNVYKKKNNIIKELFLSPM